MKEYTYPIIFIFNKETNMYNGYIHDLSIFAEGKTVEYALAEAGELFSKYIELCVKYNVDMPKPSTFEATSEKWKGYEISSVTVKV